ncbi:uncharacterized protein [Amphiura filiformis]|uniref:uncharacterized protein n=1 Tax=Amphiura filiformis TaxID=82378 RepID=UPI003B218824
MIQWEINDDMLSDGYEVVTTSSSDGEGLYNTTSQLVLMATAAWHWVTVECAASINVTDAPQHMISSVLFEVLGQSDPPVISGNLDMMEGEAEILSCMATNGYPEAAIEWLLDGDNITTTQTLNVIVAHNRRYTSKSEYTLMPHRSDNGKVLTCEVTHATLGEPLVMNVSRVLNVKYSPQVSLTKSANGPIEEGDSVTLTCSTDANPPTTHFSWVKGDDLGDGSDTLVLDSITQNEEGSYRCKAQNGIGVESVSDPVTVDVNGAAKSNSTNDGITQTPLTSGDVSETRGSTTMKLTRNVEVTSSDGDLESTQPCVQNAGDLENIINDYKPPERYSADGFSQSAKFTSDNATMEVIFKEATIRFPPHPSPLEVIAIQSSSLQTPCPTSYEDNHQSYHLASVISVNALDNGSDVTKLYQNIEFEYVPKKPNVPGNGQFFYQPRCAWWNKEEEYWTDEGCTFVGIKDKHAHCHCDHLTLFGLVGELIQFPHTDSQASAISKLAQLGHAMSIIFICLTLIIYFYCGLYKVLRVFIHTNLAISLFLSHVFLWIAFEGRVSIVSGCTAVAAIAQIAVLATYFWICMEAIHLFLCLKPAGSALGNIPLYVWFIVCWGFPLIIVLISVAAKSNSYGYSVYKFTKRDELDEINWCWLNKEDGILWSFGAPATIVFVINFVLVMLCLQELFGASNKESEREEMQLSQHLGGLRLLILMEPLLTIPWLLKLLYFHQYSVSFDYFYTIMNAFQGVFLFINQCVLDEEVLHTLKSKTLIQFNTAVRKNKVEQEQMDQLVESRRHAPAEEVSNESVTRLFHKREAKLATVEM